MIGDGNLSNSVKSKTDSSPDYRISIDISDKKYLIYIYDLIKTMIKTKTVPKKATKRGNRIPRLFLYVRNKSLFYFLNKEMEIPKGKKSSVVFVPPKIKKASNEIKRYFLAGYFDTDGGFRGRTLGFTTASKKLNHGIGDLLVDLGVAFSKDMWVNKRYKREFYGLRIKRKEIDKFLKLLPLQNKEKLERINRRFKCEDAGVVKRV